MQLTFVFANVVQARLYLVDVLPWIQKRFPSDRCHLLSKSLSCLWPVYLLQQAKSSGG